MPSVLEMFAARHERSSHVRRSERVDLLSETDDVGQAALSLPDGEGTLERLASLLDPACALEHGGEVLVGPALKPRVVRLGRRGSDGCTGESLGPFELAARGEEERLDGGLSARSTGPAATA